MDENLYKLNLDYLIVAQSLIFSDSEQKAMFCLGLTTEAVSLLRKMPLAQLKSLARSDCLTFVPVICPWRTFSSSLAPIGFASLLGFPVSS